MDPASAGVAFIGLAASLTTLAGVAINSARTLHDLINTLVNAPKDLLRLQKKVERLERLIKEVQRTTEGIEDEGSSVNFDKDWLEACLAMQVDLQALQSKVLEIASSFRRSSHSSLQLRSRIRKFLSDTEISKYEALLSEHTHTLSLMLNTVGEIRSRNVLARMKNQSTFIARQTQRIDKLTVSAKELQTSMTTELRSIKSVLANGKTIVQQEIIRSLETANTSNDLEYQAISKLRSLPKTSTNIQTDYHEAFELNHGDIFPHKHWGRCREKENLRRKHLVTYEFASYHLPLGVLTIKNLKTENQSRIGDRTESRELEFRLFPVSWLAKTMIQLSFSFCRSNSGPPNLAYTLKHQKYNDDPELLRCLDDGDVQGMLNMFSTGSARPDDILAPWGNNLLHETVVRCVSGTPDFLDMCRILLAHGADPNAVNVNHSTPLLHCTRLMNSQPMMESKMHCIATLLISGGADLSICDREGYSPCSLIYQSNNGVAYLENFVYRYIDLFTLQELGGIDFWLVTAIARSVPNFQLRLESQLLEYRTPIGLSSCRKERFTRVGELDVDHQISRLKEVTVEDRTALLRTLFAKGSLKMVEPFISCSLNLDEVDSPSAQTYLRAAARAGNVDVIEALMNAGASVDSPTNTTHPYLKVSGAVDELVVRWCGLNGGWSEFSGDARSEFWILPRMLQNVTFKGSNTLFVALEWNAETYILETLLDYGCGRRDGMPTSSWHQKTWGSEVIHAIKQDNLVAKSMVERGLAIECEDGLGCTALIHALDRGRGCLDYVRLLINHGADLTRRTSYGYSPVEFATMNLKAKHPRLPMRSGTVKPWELKTVSQAEDQRSYEILKEALKSRKYHQVAFPVKPRTFNQYISACLRERHFDFSRSLKVLSEYSLILLGVICTLSALCFVSAWRSIFDPKAWLIRPMVSMLVLGAVYVTLHRG